jgi:CAAX protease family protein
MLIEFAPIVVGAASAWHRKLWPLTVCLLAAGYLWAAALGFVQLAAVPAISALALLVWMCDREREGCRGVTLHTLTFLLAALLSLHLLPGFQNPLLLGPVSFTPDAAPFKMYLTFDKSAVGFVLILLYVPICRDKGFVRSLFVGGIGALMGIACTLPPALLMVAVRWEPKYPQGFWLWALNNALLVALAEETLFRGFLQGSLKRWLDGIAGSATIAIIVAALVFGVGHIAAGPAMVVLASLAGVAYGLAYQHGGLLGSVTAHFGVNLCHILLFTYPLLATAN